MALTPGVNEINSPPRLVISYSNRFLECFGNPTISIEVKSPMLVLSGSLSKFILLISWANLFKLRPRFVSSSIGLSILITPWLVSPSADFIMSN